MATKRVKLALLRARHDMSVPVISDAACIAVFVTNPARRSVINYWEAVTDSYLQFDGSALMPWVDISLGADTSRYNQVAKAYAATAALPGAVMDGFDGFVVITHPGTVTMPNPLAGTPGEPTMLTQGIDGGDAGPVAGGKPACALPVMTGNHTFFCHEVGHVLGFRHTYGVWNNGIDWDGLAPFDQGQVYGDPYDIMSAATFGSRTLDPTLTRYSANPTFVGPAVAGWPNPEGLTMGPEPARAHVHFWDGEALPAGRVIHTAAPVGGGTRRQHLVAAGRHAGTNLLVIHPANEDAEGRGRCYVEYRERTGWDEGLDLSGMDLARQAVVVHSLDTTSEGVRCWYRGRILVPLELDTDVAVEGTPFVVRVLRVTADGGAVEIEVSAAQPPRAISIETQDYMSVLAERDLKEEIVTPCGDTITPVVRTLETTSHYRAVTRGFGGFGAPDVASPVLSWTVGGKAVAAGSGSVEVATSESVFTVQYELDATTAELVLIARGGERYSADVTVTATEPSGGNMVMASRTFHPVGWMEGFSGRDLAKIARCMTKTFQKVGLRPRDWVIPDPNPPDPLRLSMTDRINEARMRVIVDIVAKRHPAEAQDLRKLVDLRFGT